MHILVVGGTRFIGPYVVRRLVEGGHRVTLFHRGKTPGDAPASVEHVLGDRAELSDRAEELRGLAPEVVLDMMPYREREAAAVVGVFAGVARRAVAVSSVDVYLAYDGLRGIYAGPADTTPLGEDAALRSELYPYRAQAKGPDELLFEYEKILVERAYLGEPSLPGTVLRLPYVFGPGDYQHRLFEYLKRMDDGRGAILLGERQARWRSSRSYVEDVAAAIALAAVDERAAGRTYNVGDPDGLTEAEWVRAIGRAAGWGGEVVEVPDERLPAHLQAPYDWSHDLTADSSRIREELGWAEAFSLDDALRRTAAWERANPPDPADPAKFDYPAEDAALGNQSSDNDR